MGCLCYTFFPPRRCGCIAGAVLSTAERIHCKRNTMADPQQHVVVSPSSRGYFYGRGGDGGDNGRSHYPLRWANGIKSPPHTAATSLRSGWCAADFFEPKLKSQRARVNSSDSRRELLHGVCCARCPWFHQAAPACKEFFLFLSSFFFSYSFLFHTRLCGRVSHRWFGSASLCECGRATEGHDVCSDCVRVHFYTALITDC